LTENPGVGNLPVGYGGHFEFEASIAE